eukprot:PITA_07638
MFRIVCKSHGKCYKLIIDSGSTDNLVAMKMVEKLRLKRVRHPNPYKVSWLQKGHHLLVDEKGKVCQRWDKEYLGTHEGSKGRRGDNINKWNKSIIARRKGVSKEFLRKIEESEMGYAIVRRPRVELVHTDLTDLLEEIQNMLQEFNDIVVDDLPDKLPLKRIISHHIDFNLGASLPNKATYQTSPKDNEEIRK